MRRNSLLEAAHGCVAELLADGGLALDATLGNGHDAVFLAQRVGAGGKVYGFDIQPQALLNTRARLLEAGLDGRALLILDNHANLLNHIPAALYGRFRAAMFNLGYLPGGDKSLITRYDTTLTAVEAACRLLAAPGAMTVMAYPGHAGGGRETEALSAFCGRIGAMPGFTMECLRGEDGRNASPRLFIIRRTG
ncbi:MAG: class I SAM-dependent methyltransferase [Methylomonas sp.]